MHPDAAYAVAHAHELTPFSSPLCLRAFSMCSSRLTWNSRLDSIDWSAWKRREGVRKRRAPRSPPCERLPSRCSSDSLPPAGRARAAGSAPHSHTALGHCVLRTAFCMFRPSPHISAHLRTSPPSPHVTGKLPRHSSPNRHQPPSRGIVTRVAPCGQRNPSDPPTLRPVLWHHGTRDIA